MCFLLNLIYIVTSAWRNATQSRHFFANSTLFFFAGRQWRREWSSCVRNYSTNSNAQIAALTCSLLTWTRAFPSGLPFSKSRNKIVYNKKSRYRNACGRAKNGHRPSDTGMPHSKNLWACHVPCHSHKMPMQCPYYARSEERRVGKECRL